MSESDDIGVSGNARVARWILATAIVWVFVLGFVEVGLGPILNFIQPSLTQSAVLTLLEAGLSYLVVRVLITRLAAPPVAWLGVLAVAGVGIALAVLGDLPELDEILPLAGAVLGAWLATRRGVGRPSHLTSASSRRRA